MLKAINATSDQFKTINTQVNIWRDKLIQAWRDFGKNLSSDQQIFLNNTLLDLTNKYTIYMHGYNTGY